MGGERAWAITTGSHALKTRNHFSDDIADGLVQVFARSRLGIAPLVDADKPSALTTRNNLPWFAGHGSPPARKGARTRYSGRWVDQD